MKIAIISDIHEDYASLMKAARLISQEGCEEVICLGDIVGFSVPYYDYFDTRDATACIGWVQANCRHVIAGNHDLFAVRRIPKTNVRDFVYPDDWYKLPFHQRSLIAGNRIWLYEDNELSALLDDASTEYLSGLPEQIELDVDGVRCMLTHFVHPDVTGSAREFLVGYNDLFPHLRYMKEHGCTLGFSGHIHAHGLIRNRNQMLEVSNFSKNVRLNGFDWIGLPAISAARNSSGFLIWDTTNRSVKAIPLKRKFIIP
ncbi:MAG: metallophosphoesterase family protein [Bacteroidales bacterium]